jgi:crotonobetainyl-CoA:carnitine CoA-transferase CaiB-like acyl-CoA transferase
MTRPLEGVRILEVAAWTFVPAAGAACSDLGADVIKVEPPDGDPQRGLRNLLNFGADGVNPFLEIPNRGKRSITLDLSTEPGRELLLRLAESSDVFLTSYLPKVREKLRIDVDDLRGVNPDIVYVRGSGWGAHGPMRNVGGYDLAAGWATSGIANKLTRPGEEPPFMPAAFFDLLGANAIAGAIGTALFQRTHTGRAPVVDVSLMSTGIWALAPEIVGARYQGVVPTHDRKRPGNPITNFYATKDGRWLYLVCLQSDRFWPEVCERLGRPDLVTDERFKDAASRFEHREACVEALDAAFVTRTLDEWIEAFEGFSGVWAPAISFEELLDHRQVEPNGFLPTVTRPNGSEFQLPGTPAQFDEEPATPRAPAPELGQDTEMVLLDAGLDWDEITAFRDRGALG